MVPHSFGWRPLKKIVEQRATYETRRGATGRITSSLLMNSLGLVRLCAAAGLHKMQLWISMLAWFSNDINQIAYRNSIVYIYSKYDQF